jgi:O-antigen ligase
MATVARGIEPIGVAAAGVVAISVLLGGAFSPQPRLAIGAALAVVAAWVVMGWTGSLEKEEWLVLGVIAWGALAAGLYRSHLLAAKEMVTAWLVAWLLLVLSRRVGTTTRDRMLTMLAAAAAVVAAAVMLECIGAGRLRMGGLYVNPNVAVSLMAPMVPAVWLLHRRSRRVWLGVVTGVLVVGILATGSRGGLIALMVVIGCLLPTARLRLIGAVSVAAAAAGLVWLRFLSDPDSLAWHRIAIWRALWQLVVEHPILGVGPGWLEDATGVVRIAHAESIARYRHVIGSAESVPLGVVVRTGLVGLSLAVAAVVAWLHGCRARGTSEVRAAVGTAAAMAALGAFHDFLDLDVVLWWWAVLAGVAFPLASASGSDILPRHLPSIGVRTALALSIAGMVLWGVVQPAHARRLWRGAPSSAELARTALRAEPWLAEVAVWRAEDLLRLPRWTWSDSAEALQWSRWATRVRRGSADVWSDYGLVNARIVADLGAWPDAIEGAREGFRRATELEPHLPWHWLRWAQLERTLGHADAARRLAEQAVAEEPKFVRGWLFLARVELDAGRTEVARHAFARAVAAVDRARWRLLSAYERGLVAAPEWQFRELSRALATPPSATSGGERE